MTVTSPSARKRPVNLTLNESLVAQAKTYTNNLSATMELLLAAFVALQQQAQRNRQQVADACADDWNAVHASTGLLASQLKRQAIGSNISEQAFAPLGHPRRCEACAIQARLKTGFFTALQTMLAVLHRFEHSAAQNCIEATLIAFALAFEPLNHICIDAHGQLLLERTVKLAPHRAHPVLRLGRGQIRKINVTLRAGGERREFLADGFRYLVHKLSFPT